MDAGVRIHGFRTRRPTWLHLFLHRIGNLANHSARGWRIAVDIALTAVNDLSHFIILIHAIKFVFRIPGSAWYDRAIAIDYFLPLSGDLKMWTSLAIASNSTDFKWW